MIYLLCEWANNVTPAGGCGIPSDTIEIMGATPNDLNGFYTFDGVQWNKTTGETITDGGDGFWYMHTNLGATPYMTTYANFPCTWEIAFGGTPPPPTGQYEVDPIPDGAGGFWALVVDTLGNVGTTDVPGPPSSNIILSDGVGGFWKVIVDTFGNRGTQSDPGPGTGTPILTDTGGGHWYLIVDSSGNLGTQHV